MGKDKLQNVSHTHSDQKYSTPTQHTNNIDKQNVIPSAILEVEALILATTHFLQPTGLPIDKLDNLPLVTKSTVYHTYN